ncbi:MAG TPA: hypothetical protein VFO78_11500 [Candidatus Limnocylindrales bacterium]|nr:hypothetical protein [Candidatus Limnocylindrales bacterium]
MIATDMRKPTPMARTPPSAVVWIDERRAIVAAMAPEGNVSTCEVERGPLAEIDYVAQIVRVIGDRERVVILGPGPARLALEREYVAIHRRPERLVDVEPAAELDRDDLISRLRTLVA